MVSSITLKFRDSSPTSSLRPESASWASICMSTCSRERSRTTWRVISVSFHTGTSSWLMKKASSRKINANTKAVVW